MAKRKGLEPSLARSAEPLYREIRAVLESARAGAYRAVNAAMAQAYWNVGRPIVEHEQGGRKRAAYAEAVLRSFCLAFPIRHALRGESAAPREANALLLPELSWTHYRLLLSVEDPQARGWYTQEAAEQHSRRRYPTNRATGSPSTQR